MSTEQPTLQYASPAFAVMAAVLAMPQQYAVIMADVVLSCDAQCPLTSCYRPM